MTRMENLVHLMEIQYQNTQQELQSVVTQEIAIRSKLDALKRHALSARNLNYEAEPEMRSMGADVVWERWLEKSRLQLNIELSQTLARKEAHLSLVRKSFGRLQVARQKTTLLFREHRKKAQTRSIDQIVSQSILKH